MHDIYREIYPYTYQELQREMTNPLATLIAKKQQLLYEYQTMAADLLDEYTMQRIANIKRQIDVTDSFIQSKCKLINN